MPTLLSGLQLHPGQIQRLALPVTVALVVAVAYSAAHLAWQLVPAPDQGGAPPAATQQRAAAGEADSGDSPEAIARWHLFGQADPLDQERDERIDAPETRLNLQLRGVFYSPDSARAQAIITSRGRAAEHYRVGDNLTSGGTIEAIYEDRVILRRQGSYETLSLPGDRVPLDRTLGDLDLQAGNGDTAQADDPGGAPEADAGNGDELEQYRAQLAEDPRQLSQMMNLQPASGDDGEMIGVEVSPGQDERIMELLGLETGDIVTSIDGNELDSPGRAFQAMQGLEGGSVELRVLRDGSEQTMQIDFN
ncbi:hypothetical protein HC341_17030 [Aquisalimonas sp. 2447]|uniref:type II secretion system protein N n=1 Tax=Aquisalimonas sp. 2447 TaxID=2740807 RepID=UPI0014324339|nr:type II secretion system protein N [Aquisalimonas sp. 2447]QIT56748.1 hypothetical protein HC341_17030 [Aquisalimonas sp. 2447]